MAVPDYSRVARNAILLGLVTASTWWYVRAALLPPCPDAQDGYLPMARAIVRGEPLLASNAVPCTTWPPGWSAILGIFYNRHLASIVMLAGTACVAARARGSWFLCLVIASNMTLVQWAAKTSSEAAFVFFLTLSCLGMEKRSTGLTTFAVACASITRYVGVILLPLGLVFLWTKGWRARICYFVLAPLPITLWAIRNIGLCGYSGYFGPRQASELSLADAAQAMVGHAASVALGPLGCEEALWFPAMLIIVCVLLAAWRAWRSVWLWAGLGLVAVTIYGASTTTVYFSPRFAVPLVIPFLAYAWDGLHAQRRQKGSGVLFWLPWAAPRAEG